MKITQKITNVEKIRINGENAEKMGFGARSLVLSTDFEKLHFLKNSNKIENSLFLKDILRVFLPKTMKSFENNQDFLKKSSVFNENDENTQKQYQIFMIFQKNERLELMVNGLQTTEMLIKALNEIMRKKRIKEKIKDKLQCFCVVAD